MDEKLIGVFIGIAAGAVGYWIGTFWMRPILKYLEIRAKVFADFIFYSQVVKANGLDDKMRALCEDRILANRRNSADLAACLSDLPQLYKWWLKCKGQLPELAITNLIGYSNTTEYEQANNRAKLIKSALGFKPEQ